MFTDAGWLGLKRALDGLFDAKVQRALRTYFGSHLFDPVLAAINRTRRVPQPPRTVVLIPGILGTHLWDHSDASPRLLWLDLRDPRAARELRMAPGETDPLDRNADPTLDIRPGELLVEAYGLLAAYLRHAWGMKVASFPYDWRLSIDHNARQLRAALPAGPVSIVAHSMGSLVLRRCVHLHPDVLGQIDHAVCLAAPFGGSYVPLDVLAGRYWLGRLFARLAGEPATEILSTCPGFLQLLPDPAGADMARLLHEPMTWPQSQLHPMLIPRARKFSQELRAPSSPAIEDADRELRRRTSVIFGTNFATPDRVAWDGDVPRFPASGAGDMMVPADSAWDELAMRHYASGWPHPFMAQDPDAILGIAALLRTGGHDAGPLRALGERQDWLETPQPRSPVPTEAPAGLEARRATGQLTNDDVLWLFSGHPDEPRPGQLT